MSTGAYAALAFLAGLFTREAIDYATTHVPEGYEDADGWHAGRRRDDRADTSADVIYLFAERGSRAGRN